MIGVDTNILVYASREDSPHHLNARRAVEGLVRAGRPWGLPWPCVHEFLSITTHPRVYDPPSTVADALLTLEGLVASGTVELLHETPTHLRTLASLIGASSVVGPKVHDARVAAICLDHGVTELWTADRDFSFFPALRTRNPLVDRG